ncbi:MAG TPA: SDR family NAD(P)-dependent oxidoreductase [Bryobacteraceae bacterium]|nr:SDR family NAD(P)-dependent oxidoreductase [Bryobacteraceae bacterium]
MREFKNKVAVVTGAASGIGKAIAERCAAEGMRVVLADIEAPALDAAARAMSGGIVMPYRIDVSEPSAVDAMAEAVYKEFGAVHLLFNNAGVASGGTPCWAQALDSWKWVIGVNFYGVLYGIRSFVPRMLAGGEEGRVVNTASVAGLRSAAGMAPYCATKHAVVALSETLYLELKMAKSRVSASVLCPAFVKTRIGESERNRPGAGEAQSGSPEFAAMIRSLIETGVSPESIAEKVFDAIRADQFWILTHPEFDAVLRGNADAMLARRNPEPMPV